MEYATNWFHIHYFEKRRKEEEVMTMISVVANQCKHHIHICFEQFSNAKLQIYPLYCFTKMTI